MSDTTKHTVHICVLPCYHVVCVPSVILTHTHLQHKDPHNTLSSVQNENCTQFFVNASRCYQCTLYITKTPTTHWHHGHNTPHGHTQGNKDTLRDGIGVRKRWLTNRRMWEVKLVTGLDGAVCVCVCACVHSHPFQTGQSTR